MSTSPLALSNPLDIVQKYMHSYDALFGCPSPPLILSHILARCGSGHVFMSTSPLSPSLYLCIATCHYVFHCVDPYVSSSHSSSDPHILTRSVYASVHVFMSTSSLSLSDPLCIVEHKCMTSCQSPLIWFHTLARRCTCNPACPPDSPCLPHPLHKVTVKHWHLCVAFLHFPSTLHLVPHLGQKMYMDLYIYPCPNDSPGLPHLLHITAWKCVHLCEAFCSFPTLPHMIPHLEQKVYMHQYMYT